MAAMDEEAEFANHIEMQECRARRPGLRMVGHRVIRKAQAHAAANQFEVRAVRTKRGITMVGLFSAAITRAEWEADAPYREAMAAKG
jgi:hypothetical protein